jgi:hypothetical protein
MAKEKEVKKKKTGLLKRIGIKLFKKVVFVTSRKQAQELKSDDVEKFKAMAETLKELMRPTILPYQDATVPNSAYIGSKDESVYLYDFLK